MGMKEKNHNRFYAEVLGLFWVFALLISASVSAQTYDFIAQHEGGCSAVGFYNEYVYYSHGGTVNILHKNSLQEYELAGRFWADESWCDEIKIEGDRMYLSSVTTGVVIYDLSNPLEPEYIGTAYEYPILARMSFPRENQLIGMAEQWAGIYDISDPEEPVLKSTMFFGMNYNFLYALNNDVLYGFEQEGYSGPQKLFGNDFTNVEEPFICAEYQLSENYQSPWPSYILAKSDFLYVAKRNKLLIFDISESDTMILIAEPGFESDILNFCFEGDKMYTALSGVGIVVFDMQDIYNPVETGRFEYNKSVIDMRVSEGLIGLCSLERGFMLLDATQLTNIHPLYFDMETDYVYGCDGHGDYLYLGMKEAGLKIVGIGNEKDPYETSRIDSLKLLEDIVYSNNHLYCRTYRDSVLSIVDVSNPYRATVSGALRSPKGWLVDYCIEGDHLFMIDSLYYIHMYDLDQASEPELVTTFFEYAGYLDVQDKFMITVTKGNYNSSFRKVKFFRIENDNTLTLRAEKIMDGEIKSVLLDLPFIYVYLDYRMQILKLMNSELKTCDDIDLGSSTLHDMVNIDSRLIISNSAGGSLSDGQLYVLNVDDPYDIKIEQQTECYAKQLLLLDNDIVTASRAGGYYIFGTYFVGLADETMSQKQELLNCYPNPCSEQTLISFNSDNKDEMKLELFALDGRKLKCLNLNAKQAYILQTNNLNPGMYIVRLKNTEYTHSQKLIVR